MQKLLIDSNVILDVFEDDPVWCKWSLNNLNYYSQSHILCINPVIYSEISISSELTKLLYLSFIQSQV